jgi:hypothetical protein
MRKLVCNYKIVKIISIWLLVVLTLFNFLPLSRAENPVSPYGPIFPSDSDYEEMDAEFRPDSISQSKKKLPLPSKSRPIRTVVNQQVEFNDIPNPNETIIPQRLLVDDPISEPLSVEPSTPVTAAPTIPKALSKRKPQADFAASSLTHNSPLAVESLGEGEFIVEDSSFQNSLQNLNLAVNETSGMSNLSGNMSGETYNGKLYNELSPAFESQYSVPMMVKPFGTGMLDNFTVFAGTSGFKGELDAGRNGNFGFSEGFNWAGQATPQGTISGQAGFRAVQSNVNGSNEAGKNSRNQYFITAGLFKRDLSLPIQGGVVMDWYQDKYYGKIHAQQFRYEISVRTFSNTEYGSIGGFGLSKNGNSYLNSHWGTSPEETFGLKPLTYYLLFLRKHFVSGSVVEFRGGLTAFGDTILGGRGEFPLSDRFSVNGAFSAMIPDEGHGNNGWSRETWEISVGVTFYFRGGACSKTFNPCRSMFDVAENGSFFNRIVKK